MSPRSSVMTMSLGSMLTSLKVPAGMFIFRDTISIINSNVEPKRVAIVLPRRSSGVLIALLTMNTGVR